MTSRNTKFIVIEGVDGAGCTTQTRLLTEYLKSQGHRAIATKEPTEERVGRLIREYLKTKVAHPAVDALLFAADRVEHLATVIQPALERGEHVVCDRYLESTLAYQVAEGLPVEWLSEINSYALKPDAVIILDINPETSLKRKDENARERYETVDFLVRVRENFKKRAVEAGYDVVDAEKPIMQVHEELSRIVLAHIGEEK